MRKAWWIGGTATAVAAAVAVAMVVGGGKANAGKPGGDKAKPAEVALEFTPKEVVRPVMAPMSATLEFSGPLVAPDTAVVRSRAGGTLLALAVQEGSRVKAGQALARVDLAELDSRVAERSAMLESARAQLAQAERTHESNQRLADQRFISPHALESSRAALESARAQFNAAKAQLNTTRVSLRDAGLVAPIDGVVHKRHVVPGEKLSPEQQVLTIVNLSTLELAGSVPTHLVPQLSPGMPVQLQVEGMEQPVEGTLKRIAAAAEPGSRSIGVTISLRNPGERLRAGQYAVARVVLNDPQPRLTLPETALGTTSGQSHVWAIADGALVRRAVTVGRRDPQGGRVEILSGVDPQAQVLAARFDNLSEGRKAVVAAGAPRVAAASASSATVAR